MTAAAIIILAIAVRDAGVRIAKELHLLMFLGLLA
jgi:hypothetical protein